MKYWLLLWKTWFEGEVETPWDFKLIDHTNEFKSRTPPNDKIPESDVEAIFTSFNSLLIEKFERNHVSAVILTCMIKSATPEDALKSLNLCFPDAELLNIVEIPEESVAVMADLIKRPD